MILQQIQFLISTTSREQSYIWIFSTVAKKGDGKRTGFTKTQILEHECKENCLLKVIFEEKSTKLKTNN